jgi:UDP-glucose 4-epimerase
MKALVIGGNGFIGTHLVTLLQKEGLSVRVFDRYPSKYGEPSASVEYVTGDLGNHGVLSEIVEGVDWVFHLAYTTLPKTSNDDPVYDVRSNLVDTIQLLQECCSAGVKKFVFVSSGGTIYGVPQSSPIKESHPTEPICSYGITKLAIEKYLHLFYHLKGLEYVVLRVSNPYGEGQNPNAKQGAVGVFLGRIARGESITIWGDGEVVRDYIYIEDAVLSLLAAARYRPTNTEPRVFNIGSGHGCSLNQLLEEIRSTVDYPVKVDYTPSRALDVPANVLDISLAKEQLEWEPQVDLNAGLARTWKWIKTLDFAKHVSEAASTSQSK